MNNLYCLSVNPEAQESVYQELSEALQGHNDVTADIFNNKLSYLKAAIKETFRLFPIASEISRIIQSDHVLSHSKRGNLSSIFYFLYI